MHVPGRRGVGTKLPRPHGEKAQEKQSADTFLGIISKSVRFSLDMCRVRQASGIEIKPWLLPEFPEFLERSPWAIGSHEHNKKAE
jgi:hypothetical protein